MSKEPVMFNVVIDGPTAALKRIEPKKRGYVKARKNVIYRERDAIALINQRAGDGEPLDGVYSFESLDNARTFAFLHLKGIERQIANNLDQVWEYDGTRASSG